MTIDGGPSAGPAAPHPGWGALAERASLSVTSRFGHRLMRLPGTWIGAVSVQAAQMRTPFPKWHYWWQAHYLDAVVDSGFRALRAGDGAAAKEALARGRGLLRGIQVRNFGRFTNYFYDDMAWLALAAGRLNGLSHAATGRPGRLASNAIGTLGRQLAGGRDDVLGGGIYWSKKRDYKNTPTNGPAALHFARVGGLDRARAIVGWLGTELFDPESGLYLDGIHPSASGRDVETTIYTYNQGPVLAALLQLDHPGYVDQAAELIDAVEHQLCTPGGGLRLEPGGDGSLFTGILCRYLALAARDERLPPEAAATAARLVLDTATYLAGAPEARLLSEAVQRWTIFEAAAAIG